MFKSYKIINNELYLFVDEDSEFSLEFLNNVKKDFVSVQDKIKDYIDKTNINFKKGVVYLVAGGILVSSIPFNTQFEEFNSTYERINNDPLISLVTDVNNDTTLLEEFVNNDTIPEKIHIDDDVQLNVSNIINDSVSNINNNTDKINIIITPNVSNNSTPNISNVIEETHIDDVQKPPIVTEQMVTVYRSTGTILEITLSDYLIGVVSAEMPASFNVEALKAQAVAARTYTLKRVLNNQVLSDTTINQKYEDVSTLKAKWGSDFDKYYNKVKEAVYDTKDVVITYNGNYIDAVYHSTSNGKTEDPIYVWGNEYSYLKSVDSSYDINASSYDRTVFISYETLSNLFGMNLNNETVFDITMYTSSGRVNQINVNSNMYSGKYFRELLNLRSTDFTINKEKNGLSINTKGYGHGVGMSQYGANGMANNGYTYKQILNHYYTGVVVSK